MNTPETAAQKPWTYCPECGCVELHYEEGNHKQCSECGQEWFSDIDYTEVVQKNLAKRLILATEKAELERRLADMTEDREKYLSLYHEQERENDALEAKLAESELTGDAKGDLYELAEKWMLKQIESDTMSMQDAMHEALSELSRHYEARLDRMTIALRSYRQADELGQPAYSDLISERDSLKVENEGLRARITTLEAQVKVAREALKNLIYTATKLWDDAKPIKDSYAIRAVHPTIEAASEALSAPASSEKTPPEPNHD